MKLVPNEPPGRSTRKARAFAPEMRALRAQGYTFEAIRQALATAGVHVSNATVQREVARLANGPATAAAAHCGHGPGPESQRAVVATETPGFAPPPPPSPPQPSSSPDRPAEADLRSGQEIAEAFANGRITNPLVRARLNTKDLP
ncbi:MAG: hypothetical protein KGZ67_03890 [Hydrogenophaga sp.]|jgi:hypothetical protein|nr:hypothetical protein [Hydrogenophaga sp.]